MDGTLYRYSSLRSFWIEPPQDAFTGNLLISTNAMLNPQFIIPLVESSRAGAVRSYLKRHMEEEEQHPHVGEQVARLIGL